MPLKIYCPNPNCSSAIEYALQKPVCCPYCRTDLDASFGAVKHTPTIKYVNTTPKVVEKEAPPEIEIDERNFGVDIETFGDNKGVKLGQIAEQGKTGFARSIPKRIDVKKTMASILEEARKPARVDVSDAGTE